MTRMDSVVGTPVSSAQEARRKGSRTDDKGVPVKEGAAGGQALPVDQFHPLRRTAGNTSILVPVLKDIFRNSGSNEAEDLFASVLRASEPTAAISAGLRWPWN